MNFDNLFGHLETFHNGLEKLAIEARTKQVELIDRFVKTKWKLNNKLQKTNNNEPVNVLNKTQKCSPFFNIDNSSVEGTDDSWPFILENHDPFLSGDRVMKRLQFALDNIPGVTRYEYQIQFHNEIQMAMLPKIYQKEWATHSSDILKKYNIDHYRPEMFAIMARRMGKTIACVIEALAGLYTIPNISFGIFSTCKRTAGKFKSQVLKYLRIMPWFEKLVGKNNFEDTELEFSKVDPIDIRSVSSLPAKVAVCKKNYYNTSYSFSLFYYTNKHFINS